MVYEDDLVDAIEQGKIVKVSESYAKKEGLPIIRRPNISLARDSSSKLLHSVKKEEKQPFSYLLEKASRKKNPQVLSELIDNFQWNISSCRRKRGISRTRLAELISEPEDIVKMVEYGMLPEDNFIIINKIQSVLGINLRKDKKDFSKDSPEIYPKTNLEIKEGRIHRPEKSKQSKDKQSRSSQQSKSFKGLQSSEDLFGEDIEILDDES